MRSADAAQAVSETHRAMMEVRYLGAEMGWQTAMYRSADSTVRNIELQTGTDVIILEIFSLKDLAKLLVFFAQTTAM
jgi:hypothetical protein